MTMRRNPLYLSLIATLSMGLMVGCSSSDDDSAQAPEPEVTTSIEISVLGQYRSGVYLQSAAEIVDYDPVSRRSFVVNAASGEIDVLDLSDPAFPQLLKTINLGSFGAEVNSVAVKNGRVAAAVQAPLKTDPGRVVLLDTDGNVFADYPAGALPDAVTFSPDGRYILVANEGEPNDDYTIDPEGSVTIVDLQPGMTNAVVRTADFKSFIGREDELRAAGVRIFGPGANAAQDFEPEWIVVTADSKTAYVALQENNAIAVLDVAEARVTDVFPLGFKDWSAAGEWSGNGFDASDRDDGINIRHWPVFGVYQPDTIRLYETNGQRFIVTANEGDSRDYDGWTEEFRVGQMRLDPIAFPDAATLQANENLGRLRLTSTLGISNGCDPSVLDADPRTECVYDEIYAFGARSMSLFRVDPNGLTKVFDTGSELEDITAAMFPTDFNSNNSVNNSFDTRSDDKGPEPEGLALGQIDGRTYAFLGLERIGGVMVYDITVPEETTFVQYLINRDFSLPNTPEALTTTDLGAEGLHFVPASDSPDRDGRPLLIVGNEVSGTTTVHAIDTVVVDD